VTRLGRLLAAALSGSWRSVPPAFALTGEEWARAAPTLQATASGGLAWWRLRNTPLEATAAAQASRDAFRVQTLHARLHERRLARALDLFRDAGLRPVLSKGWSVARLYPHPGLRPYGDLDLHVDPVHHAAAEAVLERHGIEPLAVDLHCGVPRLARPWSEVAARCGEVDLGSRRVAVLGPEDHLTLLSVHLLAHGAWRPLWLCDVALLLETLPEDFDWDYLGSLPTRQFREVRLVALLAHRLLGAGLSKTPWRADEELPAWLPRATLSAWGQGGHYSVTTRIALTEADPGRFLRALRVRWPNAIEATVRWGAPYNAVPRLPYQILDTAARAARALMEAPPILARRSRIPDDSDEEDEPG